MATLSMSENAERIGRLRWLVLQVFEWAGAQSRADRHARPGDARTFAEWSNVLADHAERLAARVPAVAGFDVDALSRPGPSHHDAVTRLATASGPPDIAALHAALDAVAAEARAHRRLVDERTDGPTARLLDRLAHDLARRP